jgi:hypothetical protein
VLREVVVVRVNDQEVLAICHAPGVVDEEMTLDLMAAEASLALRVRVIESHPVIIDGAVRHRIRLGLMQPEAIVTRETPAIADGLTTAEAV